MEKKAFEIVIETMAKEIDHLNTELRLEKAIREMKSEEVVKLQAEVKHLNELLTPTVRKGEANE